MTKAAKEFNEKYNLKISDSSFKSVDINDYVSEDLGGKIKKNWKEATKRFFSKPVYSISLFIFLAITIMAIIIKYTSEFSDTKEVLSEKYINSHWLSNLPKHGTTVTDVLGAVDIAKLRRHGIDFKILDTNGNEFTIEWKPWDYVHEIAKKQNISIGKSILGTDIAGRDWWTRTWSGTVNSLIIAVSIAVITTGVGSLLGSWVGMHPGSMYDILFMKIISLYNSIPAVVWFAIILALFDPGMTALFVVLIITGWQRGFGISRIYMWKYINSGFMESATTMGVSKFNRIIKHALPNYLGMIAYGFVGAIPRVIQTTAAIAFLGFALNPVGADLGNTLNEVIPLAADASKNLFKILLPTIIIFTITISLHFCAIGINDALDPKYKKGDK